MTLPLLLIAILLLFLLRVPMAFAILGPSLVYLLVEDYTLHLGVRTVMQGINSWPLLAVPLFILVGTVATRTEIADRLYDAAVLLLGPLRAGLAYVNIAVSLGFSWMSGAALADAAGIGSIEVNHMRKKGYPAEFSVGLSASSALISPIMPPSIPAVVYASVAAGIHRCAVRGGRDSRAADDPVAGREWSICGPAEVRISWVTRTAGGRCGGRPEGAPGPGRAGNHPRRHPRRRLHAHRGGWNRRALHAPAGVLLPDDDAPRMALIFRDTAVITAQIMLIIGASALLSWILAREQVPQTVAAALLELTDNPVVFLMIVNVLLLICGMILEPTSALLIITPILLPVAVQYGIDPIHLGSIIIFNLMIGLLTPPMGGVAFVLSSVTGIPVERVFRGAAFYLPAMIIVAAADHLHSGPHAVAAGSPRTLSSRATCRYLKRPAN